MYAFISGTVEEIEIDRLAINCGGVGYEVLTNDLAIGRARLGEPIKLFTRLIVREDAWTLFGFLSKEEKGMFDRLISVSGIGPKIAQAALSKMSVSELAIAIVAGDEKALSSVPGVGKKTAQRMILELKAAIGNEQLAPSTAERLIFGAPGDAAAEAVEALVAMGFDAADSAAAVALVKAEGGTPEQMAINALRRLDKMKG